MKLLWLFVTVLCIEETIANNFTNLIENIIDNFQSVQSVTIKVLNDEKLPKSFLKSKNYFVNFELDDWPSDIYIIIGEFEEAFNFYLGHENDWLFSNFGKVVLMGKDKGPTQELLRRKVSNSSKTLKFWTVYPNLNGEFQIFGISLLSKLTGGRVVDLGTSSTLKSRLEHDQMTDPNGVELRTITVGGDDFEIKWDSMVANNSMNELEFLPGFANDVFDYVEKHSGLKRVLVKPTNTWGSAKVNFCFL